MKGLLATIALAAAFAGLVAWAMNRPPSREAKPVMFVIDKGDGPSRIAERLRDSSLIRSKSFFMFTTWSRGTRGDFKAGVFELSPAMTAREIERALTRGNPVSDERSIRILEGWTLDDIARYLEEEGVMPRPEFYAQAGQSARRYAAGERLPDWSETFPALKDKPATASLEGYLFPDTYRIYVGSGGETVTRRLLANFEARLSPELRAEAAAGGRPIFEIVTMASVIEREVRGEEDRAIVSDIFWRRVDAGRGMEADSTVNYCTGKSLPAVSIKDTQVDCPWNTYKWRGLPAGPIGNPGLSALKAAARPKPNDWWYFLTDKEGKVHYAKTLDEHVANKRKYLR